MGRLRVRSLATVLAVLLAAAVGPGPASPAMEPVAFLPAQGVAAADPRLGMTLVVGPEEAAILSGPGVAVVWPLDPGAVEAVAAACDAWWVMDRSGRGGGGDGARRLTRSPMVPTGPRRLSVEPGPEGVDGAQVASLLAPWCGADDLRLEGTTWFLRLDARGRDVLAEVLDLWERPRTVVPPWLPPPSWTWGPVPGPREPAGGPAALPATWLAFATDLARRSGASVAISPQAAERPAPALAADPPAALAPLGLVLAQVGADPGWAWVVAPSAPSARRHPAERRRLTCLPVAHLARWGDAAFLADRLRRQDPARWAQPGWMVAAGPGGHLLVAADVPALHGVVDALAAWDAAAVRPPELSPPVP